MSGIASVGLPHMSPSSSLASVVLSCVHVEARPETSAETFQTFSKLAFPLPDVQDLIALTLAAQVPSQILTGVFHPLGGYNRLGRRAMVV